MERIRDAEGLTYCHPFDDPMVIAGHGTAGLELVDDLPDVDVVVVGVGGGGLISGIAAAVKGRRPSARVYGVEPERSNALSLALERGEIVQIQPESVADGLGAPFAGAWTLAMARRYVDGVDPARRPHDPGRPALHARARQAAPRAGRRRGPRGRPRGTRPDPRTASAWRSSSRAATSRSAGSGSCSMARARCPGRRRDRRATGRRGATARRRRGGHRPSNRRHADEPRAPGRADRARRPAAAREPRPSAAPPTPSPEPAYRPSARIDPPARRGQLRPPVPGASDEMRAASFYIGAIVLGTVGPFALASWVLEVSTLHRTVGEADAAHERPVPAAGTGCSRSRRSSADSWRSSRAGRWRRRSSAGDWPVGR